ncbi:hypothetical protein AALB47_18890 [Lachnospiraceae bacterium 54-11]
MKREDISDALGLVDESMISHAFMVRRKKKKLRSKRNNRWGLCNIAKLNLIGKVEGLQRELRLFSFYGVEDLDCRICICLRKIV